MVDKRMAAESAKENAQQAPDEELYTGTKIDSQEEAIASAQEAATAVAPLPTTQTAAQERAYTLGMWRVNPGQEAEFIAAWHALSNVFRRLPRPPAGKGTLVQNVSEPSIFYSFGAWHSADDIGAMRQDAQAQAGLAALRNLSSEVEGGVFRVVAESEI
jgi:hypothetical protein